LRRNWEFAYGIERIQCYRSHGHVYRRDDSTDISAGGVIRPCYAPGAYLQDF
jgi:hypothetical protein